MSNAPRRALVTGGSSGIGLAVGRELVANGYEVVLNARREGPLAEAARSIGARHVAGDCAVEDDAAAIVGAAGPVDLLIHAAGMMAGTFVRKESVATFDAVIAANLRSAFLVASAVLPQMPQGGRIVFVSSSSAHQPQPGKAAYTASKAGLQRVRPGAGAARSSGTGSRSTSSPRVRSPPPCSTTSTSRCTRWRWSR